MASLTVRDCFAIDFGVRRHVPQVASQPINVRWLLVEHFVAKRMIGPFTKVSLQYILYSQCSVAARAPFSLHLSRSTLSHPSLSLPCLAAVVLQRCCSARGHYPSVDTPRRLPSLSLPLNNTSARRPSVSRYYRVYTSMVMSVFSNPLDNKPKQ